MRSMLMVARPPSARERKLKDRKTQEPSIILPHALSVESLLRRARSGAKGDLGPKKADLEYAISE